MTTLDEKIQYKGYTIEVHYDENVSCEDQLSDDVHVWCWHRRVSIGEKPPCERDEAEETIRAEHPGAVILPIFAYEHGGIALSTGAFSCRWDSGQIGWIWSEGQQDETVLRSIVEALDNVMQGATFGYIVKNPEGETIDECWGIVGREERDGYMLVEARGAIENDLRLRESGERFVAEAFAL